MRIVGNNGNVGIGTTAPTEKLNVYGNAILERDAQNAYIVLKQQPQLFLIQQVEIS